MAAATEWRNALAAGARVTSVRRREPLRRPLSVPRPLLSRRGLARLSRNGAARARGDPGHAARAVISARPRVGRATRAGRRAVSRRGGGERGGADHLRHRVPARVRRSAAARAARRRAQAGDPWRLDRARARLHRARRSRTTSARSPLPASPRSGRTRPPTRWRGRSTRRTVSSERCRDVVHAEREGRVPVARRRSRRLPSPASSRWRCTAGGRSRSRR